MRAVVIAAALAAALPLASLAQSPPPRASLHLVLVLDGLRPDSINPQDTPNLHRLRTEGVNFLNSHAVFPTVTRVNASSISTGSYPDRHGLMGNIVYIPEVDPKRAFNNDDATKLLKLGDHILTAPSLAELMPAGDKFVAISSGSTGSALLLAPRSPKGVGTVINGYFQGSPASPPEAGEAIRKRFGDAPKKGGALDAHDNAMEWTMNILAESVLPDMKPRVVISWLTEPDHIQHGRGAGSPEAVSSIRKDDVQVGKVLAKLAALGLQDKTDIMVVSDHGFAQTVHNVNVAQELQSAGLLAADRDDVIVASSGQSIALHVKGHDRAQVTRIVEFLQQQPWCGLVFTAGQASGHEGFVRGTFSLEQAHLGGHERSPDIVFTFPWSSGRNRHGVPGTEYNFVASGATGAVTTDGANHGGIGAWTVRNTMLAWGPDFKRGAVIRTPSANVDVAPTILYLLGLRQQATGMQGRPLLEAMVDGPDEEQVAMETRTLPVANGSYRAVLQVSDVAGRRYIDKGWRVTAP